MIKLEYLNTKVYHNFFIPFFKACKDPCSLSSENPNTRENYKGEAGKKLLTAFIKLNSDKTALEDFAKDKSKLPGSITLTGGFWTKEFQENEFSTFCDANTNFHITKEMIDNIKVAKDGRPDRKLTSDEENFLNAAKTELSTEKADVEGTADKFKTLVENLTKAIDAELAGPTSGGSLPSSSPPLSSTGGFLGGDLFNLDDFNKLVKGTAQTLAMTPTFHCSYID